ncbi:MAG: HEAT repeat domain-containing protein [Propioniciclava sp.]|uniref:HEAT repeat domain-containing protein n=1 Tax=Propioniciclava sp. TaxID=2038686 RepID=UPI0039E4E954
MTHDTTSHLVSLLTHPDGTERRQAALRLGASGDPEAAAAIVARLDAEADSCVREDLTWATVQLIDAALPDVVAMLGSDEPDARRTGAHVLSKVGNPDHFEMLAPLVADAHADVAIKAYRAVANTGRPEAVAALATRLGDGDALQRDALTAAFVRCGEASVPVLIDALSDPDAGVRAHAAETLGDLGETAASAADALAARAGDPDVTVRVAATSALGQLGEASAAHLSRLSASADATIAAIASRFTR